MDTVPSVKRNFAYKSILTVSNYLMAFITFPYISRILGVANVGLVNFVQNTVDFFLLFASMGVNILGVREIAKAKDDRDTRNKVFSNILGSNILFTVITLLVYIVIILSSPKLSLYSALFYVGAAKIIFSTFLVEWLYTGIEDFKYITIRSIIIKALYICAVFTFVKRPEDYILYFYLTISVTVVNAAINIIHARKFIHIETEELFKFKYLRDNSVLGIYNVMTSMYLTFNVMYLGFVSDNEQVGFYTTAFRLYSVILAFFSAFTNVMLPRVSSLIAGNEQDKVQLLIDKSFAAMAIFSIPLVCGSIVLAPDIIYVLSGPGYEGAIIPMRIIMPAVIFVGIAQIIAIQILAPLKKDNVLLAVSVIGAVLSITINLSCVNNLQAVGSAFVLVASEGITTGCYLIYIKLKTHFRFDFRIMAASFALSIPSVVAAYFISMMIDNRYLSLTLAITVSILLWGLCAAIYRRKTDRKATD